MQDKIDQLKQVICASGTAHLVCFMQIKSNSFRVNSIHGKQAWVLLEGPSALVALAQCPLDLFQINLATYSIITDCRKSILWILNCQLLKEPDRSKFRSQNLMEIVGTFCTVLSFYTAQKSDLTIVLYTVYVCTVVLYCMCSIYNC